MSVNSQSTEAVIGRDAELAATQRLIEALPEGPAALLIEGEAGIGKTTIVRHAMQVAANASYRVLSCRPVESETKLSFTSLADLMEPVADDVLPELPEPQQRALEAALLRTELESGPPDQRAVATGFVSTVKRLSEEGPVLLAVDDVPWLDGSSQRVLEFAARRLGDASVGILVARRGSDARAPLALDRAVPDNRLERCCLGPLSAAALHEVIKTNLGLALPRPTLVKLRRACGGNPFYALEMAASLPEQGEAFASERLPVPGDISRLISDRIGDLPKRTQDALLQASGLSQPTVELLDEDALAVAEEAELIAIGDDGRVTFRHPIFAAAVYERASAGQRRRLHRKLADFVQDVEEQARHRALATRGPDASVAAILDRAAARARARGAPDAAAELMEKSCRLTPPGEADELHRRKLEAAEHHFRAGDLERARTLLSGLVSDPDCSALRAKARYLLASVCYHEHSIPEALDLLNRARGEAGGDRELAVAIDLELAYTCELGGNTDAAEAPARRALAQAEQLAQPGLLAEALAVSAIADFLQGRGLDDRIDRALALEDPDRQVPLPIRPSLIAAHLDLYVGELDRAVDRLRDLRQRVVDLGEETDLPYACATLAWAECRRGNPEAATGFAAEGLETARQLESEPLRGYALALVAFAEAYRGGESAARAAAHEALALLEPTGELHVAVWSLAGLAVLELSLGNYEAADKAVAALVQPVESMGLGDPIHSFWLPDAIEALIGVGDLERAERLIGMLEDRAQELERTWALAAGAHCRGLLIGARGDLDVALARLQEAVNLHQRTGMPIELARTLLAKGQIERRARHKAKARESLEEAQAVFERVGAQLWARRASSELDGLGLRRIEPHELSPIERRVAELAASGLTNREIAAELFMSPKTVEAHLGHAYRKLGIRSRAQLGANLAGVTDNPART